MKTDLKRIEATLNQLGSRNATTDQEPSASRIRAYSFEILPAVKGSHPPKPNSDTPSQTLNESTLLSATLSVQPFPAQQSSGKTPTLPKFKAPSFSSHRNGSNPALAMNLLKEIQTNIADWQTELQKIVRQIQDIYLEGPIVDGWLESHPREPETGAYTVRLAQDDRLMDYVEENVFSFEPGQVICETPRAGYRLCGLDASGQMWSRPCPPEQLPSVSIAIARYQKLRQLLGRKQYLETRLGQLAETLVVLHSHLQS